MKTILIGVSGGIACYKAVELVKSLMKNKEFNVEIMMTEHSTSLISPEEFKTTGCPVHTELFHRGFDYRDYIKQNKKIRHISISDRADIVVIAPATANIIGKIANGMADDLLTTTVIAARAPVLICPSMNSKMYENPITQLNIEKLKSLGYNFIDPEHGMLACGYDGVGRLADIKKIEADIISILEKYSQLKGKTILVTAGAFSEEIDPVRLITNRSSGKMGIFIAQEAAKRGAEVTIIRGNTDIAPSGAIKDIRAQTSSDLLSRINENISSADIIIHAAAVPDFKVSKKSSVKIKSNKGLSLKLMPSEKIINQLNRPKGCLLVSFKAEHNVPEKDLIKRATLSLIKSSSDIVVANDVSKNQFGSELNEVFIIDKKEKVTKLKQDYKRVIASRLWDLIYSNSVKD